jgi:hypothetical protein
MEDVVHDRKILTIYHTILSIFSHSLSNSLSLYHSFDHLIELKEGDKLS